MPIDHFFPASKVQCLIKTDFGKGNERYMLSVHGSNLSMGVQASQF